VIRGVPAGTTGSLPAHPAAEPAPVNRNLAAMAAPVTGQVTADQPPKRHEVPAHKNCGARPGGNPRPGRQVRLSNRASDGSARCRLAAVWYRRWVSRSARSRSRSAVPGSPCSPQNPAASRRILAAWSCTPWRSSEYERQGDIWPPPPVPDEDRGPNGPGQVRKNDSFRVTVHSRTQSTGRRHFRARNQRRHPAPNSRSPATTPGPGRGELVQLAAHPLMAQPPVPGTPQRVHQPAKSSPVRDGARRHRNRPDSGGVCRVRKVSRYARAPSSQSAGSRSSSSQSRNHTLSVPSLLPDRAWRPSEPMNTELTPSRCPSKVRTHLPVATSHSLRVFVVAPQLESPVPAAGQGTTPVAGEAHRAHPALMPFEGAQALTGGHLPQLQRACCPGRTTRGPHLLGQQRPGEIYLHPRDLRGERAV